MFELWKSLGKNIKNVEQVMMKRKLLRSVNHHSGWRFMKKRDVQKDLYGGDLAKTEKALEGATSIPDDRLPDDEEERLYLVKHVQEVDKNDVQQDEFAFKGEVACDEDTFNALMGEHGVLSGDANTVAIAGLSEADQAKFFMAVETNEGAKVKKVLPPKPGADDLPPLGQDTAAEKMKSLLPKMLEEATKARSFSISLKANLMAQQVVAFMTSHSEWLEKTFEASNNLLKSGCDDDDKYQRLLDRAEQRVHMCYEYKSIAQGTKKKSTG